MENISRSDTDIWIHKQCYNYLKHKNKALPQLVLGSVKVMVNLNCSNSLDSTSETISQNIRFKW